MYSYFSLIKNHYNLTRYCGRNLPTYPFLQAGLSLLRFSFQYEYQPQSGYGEGHWPGTGIATKLFGG